ncbi:hypothetical protein EDB85DRAFT_2231041 [Lactarius pseudohatsudake]|nr:hypothetical protein EDB85DRAFT_2231041 [Lactarius pseudohatsudake]
MAFFTSPEQEVFEHRLKRSPSLTSVRTRPSTVRSTSPRLRPAPIRTLHPSPIPSPIPSPVPATSPNLNGPDYVVAKIVTRFRGRSTVHEPVQRRQHLDTSSSPSSLPLDSRRDFDTGSLSDSGVNSRRPRSPRRSNLSAPSPHNVHLSPPMARPSPSSPNLPIAGYFSDGERSPSFLHPSRLDVKRLLSKPAAPSVNSTISITSDSESNAAHRAQPNSKEAWPSKATRMQVHFQPSSQPSSTPPTESTELLPTSPPPAVQPRQRNLLRKRSASKQTRASVSATLPGKATASSALQPATRSSATASSRSEFSTTTLQFVIASRTALPVSAPPHGSSSKLTPASAIAQAYKEQDLRREALAAAPVPRIYQLLSQQAGRDLVYPIPQLLETSPDRIVLVGSVEDNSYDAVDAPSSGSHSAPAGASVGQPIRSLTRKVSARFRRGRPVVTRDSSTQSVYGDGGDGELPLSGDPSSRHERLRSASYPKVKSKLDSPRPSLDQRNVAVPSGESLDRHDHRPVPSESCRRGGLLTPQSKGKHKPQEDDTGAGGRLWRLVKRISAGGLRERFYTTVHRPPVQQFRQTCGSGGAEPGGGGDHESPTVGHSKDPHPSTSAVRPNADDRSDMTCTTLTGVPPRRRILHFVVVTTSFRTHVPPLLPLTLVAFLVLLDFLRLATASSGVGACTEFGPTYSFAGEEQFVIAGAASL